MPSASFPLPIDAASSHVDGVAPREVEAGPAHAGSVTQRLRRSAFPAIIAGAADMSPTAKSEAEKNGRQADDDGNQKIDSLMEKAAPTKREKEGGESGGGEERPSKSSKKGGGQKAAVGNGDKANAVADEKQVAALEPGGKEETGGEDEGKYKVLERGQ